MKRLMLVIVMCVTTMFAPVSRVAFAGGEAGTEADERDYSELEAKAPMLAQFQGGYVEVFGALLVVGLVILFIALIAGGGGGGGGGVDSSPSSSYTPSSSDSSSPSRCIHCSGSGQVKVQDRWGSDANGKLINEYHYETCRWCGGRGEK